MSGRTSAAVADLDRLLAEDAVRHDGGEHLTGQVLGVRTLPGPDGARMVSTRPRRRGQGRGLGRQGGPQGAPPGSRGIVLPTSVEAP